MFECDDMSMPTPEEIKLARTKGNATRLRNLLSKQAEYSVLNRNETQMLKRLLEQKDAADSAVAETFQFRLRAPDRREAPQTSP